jgi:hypothetical protein
MKHHKDFDCVQMKWEIQQRLLSEFERMNPSEARRAQQERIAADPLLGKLLRQVPPSRPAFLPSKT